MKRFSKALFSLMPIALLLTACGGGGGGANGSAPGFLFDSIEGFNNFVTSVALANDGSGDIYVAGGFNSYKGVARSRIARLNSDGSLDEAFDPGVGFDIGRVSSIAVALDGSGDIYAGGLFSTYQGQSRENIVRINSDGSIDTGFVPGSGFSSSGGSSAEVRSIAVATDGSGDIYVGGDFTDFRGNVRNRIARVNSDGSNDAGFDTGSGFDSSVFTLALASDGSGDIYLGGAFDEYRGNSRINIARVNSDGSNDASFVTGSGFDTTGVATEVNAIAPALDGSGDIYAGGLFFNYRGNLRNKIVRINGDGSHDADFDPGAAFGTTLLTGRLFSLLPVDDGSGDIYAGGTFINFDGVARSGAARINSDGTLDTLFDPGVGFRAILSVCCIVSPDDGSGDIIAAGQFTSYQSIGAERIARVDMTGGRI